MLQKLLAGQSWPEIGVFDSNDTRLRASLPMLVGKKPRQINRQILKAALLTSNARPSLVAPVLGVVATARGLALTVDLGAAVVAIMSTATFVLAIIAHADVPKIEGTR